MDDDIRTNRLSMHAPSQSQSSNSRDYNATIRSHLSWSALVNTLGSVTLPRQFTTMQDHVMVDEPDASLFQLVSSQALQSLLDRIVGPKTLVLSSSLAGPLGLITEVGLLKVSQADFDLTREAPPVQTNHRHSCPLTLSSLYRIIMVSLKCFGSNRGH